MSTPFEPSLSSASTSSASVVKKSAFRQFLSDAWKSYCAHAELNVMLRSGQWLNHPEIAKLYEKNK